MFAMMQLDFSNDKERGMISNDRTIDPAEARLDQFAGDLLIIRAYDMGYPVNQKSQLVGFYKWFAGSGMNLAMVNNAGDPFDKTLEDCSGTNLSEVIRAVVDHVLHSRRPSDG